MGRFKNRVALGSFMHYAVFSDIHGNFTSLERFFTEVRDIVDQYFCLGDMVQYGNSFDENRCVELVQRNQCLTVRGNHEDKVLANYQQSLKKMYPQNLDYLASLSSSLVIEPQYFLVHAPSGQRIISDAQAGEEFSKLPLGVEICFFGHSHQPSLFSKDKKGRVKKERLGEGATFLREGSQYLINPGGVGLYWGLPQTYLLFDSNSRKLQFRRIDPANTS